MILLDTDVMIDLLRGYPPAKEWFDSLDDDAIFTLPGFVMMELDLSHNAGLIDTLVGQTAVSLKVPLHTFNKRHYQFIPELETVQPYVKA